MMVYLCIENGDDRESYVRKVTSTLPLAQEWLRAKIEDFNPNDYVIEEWIQTPGVSRAGYTLSSTSMPGAVLTAESFQPRVVWSVYRTDDHGGRWGKHAVYTATSPAIAQAWLDGKRDAVLNARSNPDLMIWKDYYIDPAIVDGPEDE